MGFIRNISPHHCYPPHSSLPLQRRWQRCEEAIRRITSPIGERSSGKSLEEAAAHTLHRPLALSSINRGTALPGVGPLPLSLRGHIVSTGLMGSFLPACGNTVCTATTQPLATLQDLPAPSFGNAAGAFYLRPCPEVYWRAVSG